MTENPIKTNGLHNPEHVFGEVSVEVTQEYMSEEEGLTVGIRLKYPNGTVSTVRLEPDQADDLAHRLKTVAGQIDK